MSGGRSGVSQGFLHARAALTAQGWAWFMFATQKLRAVGKQNCLLTQGLAHDECGIALRQKEKAPLECNCVLTTLTAAIFYRNHRISSARFSATFTFFPPKQEA